MAFMQPEYAKGKFLDVEDSHGDSWLIPSDVVGANFDLSDLDDFTGSGEAVGYEVRSGYFAHLSASGYMDQTEWSGPFSSLKKAKQHIEDMWEVDPDTGDEL
jgi:hypothetical protein